MITSALMDGQVTLTDSTTTRARTHRALSLACLRVFRAILKPLPRHFADAIAFVIRCGLPGIIKIGWRPQAVGQQEVDEMKGLTSFFPDEALKQLHILGSRARSPHVQRD